MNFSRVMVGGIGRRGWPGGGGGGTTPVNYFEHNWRGGEDADIKSTQNVNYVNTWNGGSLNLWFRNVEVNNDAIFNVSFETHKNYDGGQMDLTMWMYDTDDGSLPDTKIFEGGVRLWNDGINLLQAITTTQFTKIMTANNVIYKATHTITPTGNTGAGKKYAVLKLLRTDSTSGLPLVQTITIGYGLA